MKNLGCHLDWTLYGFNFHTDILGWFIWPLIKISAKQFFQLQAKSAKPEACDIFYWKRTVEISPSSALEVKKEHFTINFAITHSFLCAFFVFHQNELA